MFSDFYFRSWRNTLLALCLAVTAYLLYFRHLGSLVPGYSAAELHTLAVASDWHHILHNPVGAPFTIPVWLLTAVLHHGALAARVVAATFGLLAAVVFYVIARLTHGYRVSFLGTLLFATSAGLLHNARLGTSGILQMGILVLIAMFLIGQRLAPSRRALFGYWTAALLALLWYVPGMIWFEIFGIAAMAGSFRRQIKRTPASHLIGWLLTFLVLITPLVYASGRNWHVAMNAAGLPQHLHELTNLGTNLWHTVLGIGIHSYGSPVLWVGHAPLLNAIELLLGLFGLYYYLWRVRDARSVFLIGGTLLALLLISLGGTVGWACAIPLLYCFLMRGTEQLLERWLAVFPRNPIARSTGIALVCIMLLFSVLYQVRAYFVAWPHTTATKQAFSHKE